MTITVSQKSSASQFFLPVQKLPRPSSCLLSLMLTIPSFPFSGWGWLAVIGGAFVIGLNKGGLTGLGILPVLIFAMVFQARESTGYILPLLIVGDLCAIVAYRRVVIWKVFWMLLPPAFVGVVTGYLLMKGFRIGGNHHRRHFCSGDWHAGR